MTNSNHNIFSLKSKIIVITGANGFLGRNICKFISQLGGSPIMIDINSVGSKSITNKLQKLYKNNPKFYHCDITDFNQLKKVSKKIIKDYKKVHGLINNAALNPKINSVKKNKLWPG